MNWNVKRFSMLNISQVILMRTDSNLCRKELTVHWSAPNSLIRSYLQPCTNAMWGDESEAVAPIIWLYQIVNAQKEEVVFPELLITLRSYDLTASNGTLLLDVAVLVLEILFLFQVMFNPKRGGKGCLVCMYLTFEAPKDPTIYQNVNLKCLMTKCTLKNHVIYRPYDKHLTSSSRQKQMIGLWKIDLRLFTIPMTYIKRFKLPRILHMNWDLWTQSGEFQRPPITAFIFKNRVDSDMHMEHATIMSAFFLKFCFDDLWHFTKRSLIWYKNDVNMHFANVSFKKGHSRTP